MFLKYFVVGSENSVIDQELPWCGHLYLELPGLVSPFSNRLYHGRTISSVNSHRGATWRYNFIFVSSAVNATSTLIVTFRVIRTRCAASRHDMAEKCQSVLTFHSLRGYVYTAMCSHLLEWYCLLCKLIRDCRKEGIHLIAHHPSSRWIWVNPVSTFFFFF